MRKVDQQDETNEQEEARANHGEVVAPNDEERVRNEKGENDHADPGDKLGSPESVLDWRASVLRVPDTDEHHGHDDVEETEGEIDALDRDVAVALLAVALDVDVVECEVRQLLHGPVREHDPRDDRVDEEDEGVGDTGSDARGCQLSAWNTACMRTYSRTSHTNCRRRCMSPLHSTRRQRPRAIQRLALRRMASLWRSTHCTDARESQKGYG